MDDKKLLKIKDVMFIVSLSRSFIYKLMSEGSFPKPIKIKGSALWVAADVDKWVEDISNKTKRN